MLEHRSSKSCDAKLVVSRLLQTIQLDQASLEQPDSDTKKLLRCLGREAIRCDRPDVVLYLREITPAGTTGEFLLVRLCGGWCFHSGPFLTLFKSYLKIF